jgi:hypothetical protein
VSKIKHNWDVMFFFRAAFWIAVVIVLVPRALDPMISRDQPIRADLLAGFQTSMLTNLARVKADLKAQTTRSMTGTNTPSSHATEDRKKQESDNGR